MRIDLKFSSEDDPRLLALQVEHQTWLFEHNRLGSYLQGRPLSQWIRPYTHGMRQWKGIFYELADVFNTSSYTLWVHGPGQAAAQLRAAAAEYPGQVQVYCAEESCSSGGVLELLDGLQSLAAQRFLRQELSHIRRMAEEPRMWVFYDPQGYRERLTLMRSDWKPNQGRFAIPLALVAQSGEADAVEQAARISGIVPAQLVICVVNGDEGKSSGICTTMLQRFGGAWVVPIRKLEKLSPQEIRACLEEVLCENIRRYIDHLMQGTLPEDWTDASKVQALLEI